jgi:hypothetical protein
VSKLKLAGLGAVVLLIASGWIVAWFKPPREATLYRAIPVVYKAPDWSRTEDIKRAPLAECPQIETLAPTPKEKAKIEEKLRTIIPPGDLLTIKEAEPLPYGGKLLVTLPPKNPDGTPRPVEVTVVPNARPFFQWLGDREVGIYGGLDQDLQRVVSMEAEMRLFRTGPAIWKAKVGTFGTMNDRSYYGLVGISVRF